jgi:hypothetical protein
MERDRQKMSKGDLYKSGVNESYVDITSGLSLVTEITRSKAAKTRKR